MPRADAVGLESLVMAVHKDKVCSDWLRVSGDVLDQAPNFGAVHTAFPDGTAGLVSLEAWDDTSFTAPKAGDWTFTLYPYSGTTGLDSRGMVFIAQLFEGDESTGGTDWLAWTGQDSYFTDATNVPPELGAVATILGDDTEFRQTTSARVALVNNDLERSAPDAEIYEPRGPFAATGVKFSDWAGPLVTTYKGGASLRIASWDFTTQATVPKVSATTGIGTAPAVMVRMNLLAGDVVRLRLSTNFEAKLAGKGYPRLPAAVPSHPGGLDALKMYLDTFRASPPNSFKFDDFVRGVRRGLSAVEAVASTAAGIAGPAGIALDTVVPGAAIAGAGTAAGGAAIAEAARLIRASMEKEDKRAKGKAPARPDKARRTRRGRQA